MTSFRTDLGSKSSNAPDLFATSGDLLRIWEMKDEHEAKRENTVTSVTSPRAHGPGRIAAKAVLKNQRRSEPVGSNWLFPVGIYVDRMAYYRPAKSSLLRSHQWTGTKQTRI